MAKISELPLLVAPLGTEPVVAIKGGVSHRVPIGDLVKVAAEPVLAPLTVLSEQRVGVPGNPVAGAGAATADNSWRLDTPFEKGGKIEFGVFAHVDSQATLLALDGDDEAASVQIELVGGQLNIFLIGDGDGEITLPMPAGGQLVFHAVAETLGYQVGPVAGDLAWSFKEGLYDGGGGWTPGGGFILQMYAVNRSVEYPLNVNSYHGLVSEIAQIEAAPGAEMRKVIGPVDLDDTGAVGFDAASTFFKDDNLDRGGVRYLKSLSRPASDDGGKAVILVYAREDNVLRRRASYVVAFAAGVSALALGAGLPFIPLKPGHVLALSNNIDGPVALLGHAGVADRALVVSAGTPAEIVVEGLAAYEPLWQFDVRELVNVSSRQLFGRYVPSFTSITHVIAWDQSNTSGADSTPILTTAASIYHITFAVGSKMTKPGIVGPGGTPGVNPHIGTIKAYEEDTVSPLPVGNMGQSPIGPTMASASRRMYARGGSFQRFFGSYAGFPGTVIDNLEQDDPWWQNYLFHIAKAKEHTEAIGFRYSTGPILTGHGESDQVGGTPFETYFAKAEGVVDDLIAAAQLNDGREATAHVLVITPTYGITNSDCASRTWIKLAKERDDVHFVAPGYVFPYANEVHYSNVGQLLRAEYWGRAIDQLAQGFKPDCAEWSRAWRRGNIVYASVMAPEAMGWSEEHADRQVIDKGVVINGADGDPLAIEAMSWSVIGRDRGTGWPISLLAIETSGGEPAEFRYAMDNQGNRMWGAINPETGVGGQIHMGGSGNICDATSETVEIAGQSFRLAHYAPPVTLALKKIE